ncbi:MAG: hypothetical protein HC919_12715 [Oscillatoriales cyanobacterium SM2_2_1]|nr:hypothetical protein [Oscillatoriales cyanobacterium SM2_2_1]
MTYHSGISSLLIVALLLLTGCATTQRPQVSESQIAVLSDLAESRWRLVYDNPSFGHREYDLIFREAGKLINTHSNEKTPDDDRWEASGKKVVLSFNNGFAVYKGELSDDGNQMSGTATSRTGGEWKWTAYRLSK